MRRAYLLSHSYPVIIASIKARLAHLVLVPCLSPRLPLPPARPPPLCPTVHIPKPCRAGCKTALHVLYCHSYRISFTRIPPENQPLPFGVRPYKLLGSRLPPSVTAATTTAAMATPTPTAITPTETSTTSTETTTTTKKEETEIFLFDWRILVPECSVPFFPSGGRGGALSASFLVSGDASSSHASSPGTAGGTAGAVAAGAAAATTETEATGAVEFVGRAEVRLPTEPEAAPFRCLQRRGLFPWRESESGWIFFFLSV